MNKQEFPKLTETKTRERYLDGRAAGIEVGKAEAAKSVGMPEEKFTALIK